jgi:diguanylate cyclase (GGDEF)-like protein
LIEHNTRKSDQLFRYGGEEFVLLLPGVDGSSLQTVMNNLQQVLRRNLKYPGGSVTSSFGVALLGHGERVESWLARADEALYQAKETGRDRIVFADESAQFVAEPA